MNMKYRSTCPTRASKQSKSYKFVKLTKPLAYDVRAWHDKFVLRKGLRGVEVAFRASPITRVDDNGKVVHLNVYRYKGIVIYG